MITATQEGSDASRAEFSTLLRLAWPIILAQLAQMAMGVMDTIMAGRLSAYDLAGISLGQNLLWPSQVLLAGLVMAATPMIAQMRGAGRIQDVGEVVRQGFWIVLTASLILIVFWWNAAFVYRALDVEQGIANLALGYLQATSFGIPALLGYFLLRYLCEGLGETRPAMIIALIALVLKLPLNYALMYGAWGFPRLGAIGCGYSTAVLWWLEFLIILYIVRRPFARATGLFERFSWPDFATIKRFVMIGLPIGATTFAEVAAYSGIGLLLGQFGAQTVAAHQIVANLNGVTFMIPMALGMAATIRVGYNVGANDFPRARLSAIVALRAATLFALAIGLLLLWLRFEIVSLYTTEVDVIALAATVALFVAVYQLADDTQVVALGALRGYKDTQPPMWIALFGYWVVAIPVAIWLGFGWGLEKGWGIYGFWTGLTVGLSLVAALLIVRLLRTTKDIERIKRLATH